MVSFKPLPLDSHKPTEVLGALLLEITHVDASVVLITETLGSPSA